jgi:diguanylate cyclase (GGDEF)-like protein/PAS domain S-box-containing protein
MFKKHLSGLRGKMLLIAALSMLLIFTLLYFAARTVLLDGYSKLENNITLIQLNSAKNLLDEQAEQLSTTVRDNAHWDDLYKYMLSPNKAFIESSFNDATFANNKINALFIINENGDAVYKKGLDYQTGKPWHIPDNLTQAVSSGGILIDPAKNNHTGLLWTPEGICIVSAFDILTSNNSGPRHGTLVMVRLLDAPLIKHIEKFLDAKLSVETMRDDEISFISSELSKDKPVVMPLNDTQVAGFAILNTLDANTKLVLNTVNDRKIYQQGKSSITFLYWSLGLIGLLLASFSWFLDKLVLTRLAHLNKNVKRIGESATMSGRVEALTGDDELSSLASGINGMLERLDDSQHELQFEKDRAQVTLAGIADAVITSDDNGNVLYMNKAAERLTGVDAAEAAGKTMQSLFHLMSEDKTTHINSVWLTDTTSNIEEVLLERADGQEFVISKSTSSLHDINGVLFGNVTVLHDVTMLRALSNQLSYQARYDSLTGLVNRYEFDRKTQATIEDSLTGNRVHCLAYIDLDKFKVVNDTCGHMAGDLLLKQLSAHIKSKVRNSDTLARLGGDEFAILLMGCTLDKAKEIVENVLRAVQEYRFTFEGKVFKVGASIGLTEISPSKALTISELLATVDSACYAAKSEGGNRINVYHPGDSHMKERINQLEWVSRINVGLEKNQFVLYMQPFKSLNNKEKHCELLIRMQGDNDTLYPPGAFLPAAERYHLMPQIDRWVVNEALSVIASRGAGFDYVCAINLSGQSLSQHGFLEYVVNKIEQHGVDTRRLCFEITETTVITNLDKARQFMHALRAVGCRFSLDDFGSGLSSFAYLKNLEVDFLKIDGMFVKSIVNNKIDHAMVESINNIGHVMGLQTIAEFAENADIIDMLKIIGVDYAQGYGVEMPKLFK